MTEAKKKRILVAENVSLLEQFKIALKEYDVVACSTLQQADRWLLEDGINLFLVNGNFDEFRAMDLVKLVRADQKHASTPIIIYQWLGALHSQIVKQTFEIMLKAPKNINKYIDLSGEPAVGEVLKPLIESVLLPHPIS